MKAKLVSTMAVALAIFGVLILAAPVIRDHTRVMNELEQARAMIGPDWPELASARVTTAGDIYLENLDGQITAIERRLARRGDDRLLAHLAMLRYHRFQVSGNLEDAEAARRILSEAWEHGDRPSLAAARARVLIGFHEFDEAESVLRLAEEAGVSKASILELRDSLARVRGKSDTAAGDRPINEALAPVALVGMAADLEASGRPVAASQVLKAAQDRYLDTSPYTLAWIHVQQGIVFLNLEDYPSARLFFAAAYQRFPEYTLAAEHLAETELALGNFEEAAQLYRVVAERSGHPEFYHQLSKAERALGRETEVRKLEERARAGYGDLLEKYPRMYADHAARYYIDVGERESALALASLNLSQRNDPMARELMATARECCR